jgi:hypothetical protein
MSYSEQFAIGTRVMLSAHLWKAASAFDFAVAWNEKKHWLVKDFDFTEFLAGARADDLDVLGACCWWARWGLMMLRGGFIQEDARFEMLLLDTRRIPYVEHVPSSRSIRHHRSGTCQKAHTHG